MGGLGGERVTVMLRFRSFIRRYRIKYFTEFCISIPENHGSGVSLAQKNRLDRRAMAPWDVVYGVFRVKHILCRFGAIEECKNA